MATKREQKAVAGGQWAEERQPATSHQPPATSHQPAASEEDRPRYVISVAAEILHLHPQTLRLYEREGLVEPRRTGGKIRLYSERDLDRIRRITRLTNELGVNLAGADIIMEMRERILEMRQEIDRMRRQMEAEMRRLLGE